MNEDVLEAQRCLVFLAILTVFYCVFCCCLAYCNNGDDDHPTHPGHSVHVIKAAGIHPSVLRSIPVVSYKLQLS
ncbi:unnamed protein product [Arabidopsis halleri]